MKKRRRALGLLLTVAAVMFVAEPTADAVTAPAFEVHANIAYAPAAPAGTRGHLLDLYLPRDQAPHSRPVLIAMGGSGWFSDNGKTYASQLAPFFTRSGFAVAGVSTRSSRQAIFPAQLYDVKAAIRWLRANAKTYNLDPTRIAVMGDSSGGWTATMAGVTGHLPALNGTVGVTTGRSDVQAVIDLYGPMDFLQMDPHMLPGACAKFNKAFNLTSCHEDPHSPESSLLGAPITTIPQKAKAANPITYVSKHAPPFLIIQGAKDALVPAHQSTLLFTALSAENVPATYYVVPNANHDKRIVSATNDPAVVRRTPTAAPAERRPTLKTIEAFLRQALNLPNSPSRG